MNDLARPNPDHERLEELLATAQRTHDTIAAALDRPHALMTEGDTWTGPTTAAMFCEDVGHHRRELRAIADDVVDEIRNALSDVPESLDQAA